MPLFSIHKQYVNIKEIHDSVITSTYENIWNDLKLHLFHYTHSISVYTPASTDWCIQEEL